MKNYLRSARNTLCRTFRHVTRRFGAGTLVYLGLNRGDGFNEVFRHYEHCYGFEANPDLMPGLRQRFRGYPNVHLINAAVADEDGEIEFHISNNDGASSIGRFKDDWMTHQSGQITMERTVRVPSANLLRFLESRGVTYIDSYISDIQGFDLQVLKTLEPWIADRCIASITCEVCKDRFGNIYADLPDNSESGFHDFLGEHYQLAARGWGIIADGEFKDVPEDWWCMDCKWRVKVERSVTRGTDARGAQRRRGLAYVGDSTFPASTSPATIQDSNIVGPRGVVA